MELRPFFPPRGCLDAKQPPPALESKNAKTWPARFRLWRKWNRKVRAGLVLRPPQLAGAEATVHLFSTSVRTTTPAWSASTFFKVGSRKSYYFTAHIFLCPKKYILFVMGNRRIS